MATTGTGEESLFKAAITIDDEVVCVLWVPYNYLVWQMNTG